MTLCQRPKECEPSRYRHGSDPPKQIDTASLTDSRRPLSPSSTPSSLDPFIYIQSQVTESQAETMSAPIKREVSKESILLLHFSDSVVHVRPCLYTSRQIRT